MSDYEVNLVNDSMQEFYVKFKGPAESESALSFSPSPSLHARMRHRFLEDA